VQFALIPCKSVRDDDNDDDVDCSA